ncbi:hypothetical protein Y032_0324g2518 [Ancylostoma ceylanicum]|uniref:Uncharacterized protein n=1 Tax=Ancylostoma ceylanicum TaxID=53326 RepID=A0A016S173_9BILA|nr:hypothetical protein Y032_0324g2518 [Ancylostoma ceylanicum]
MAFFSYCLSTRTLKCGCATAVDSDCRRVNTVLADDIQVCKVPETAVVPTPVVHPQGSTAVSVIVPRFFSAPPFDTLSPSRLTLLADFATKKEPLCEEHPSISAQKWGKNHCTLRIPLSMPGIDHKSDDHYYYDDQTPLESEYSLDLFEKAELVRFFVQVNVERHLK